MLTSWVDSNNHPLIKSFVIFVMICEKSLKDEITMVQTNSFPRSKMYQSWMKAWHDTLTVDIRQILGGIGLTMIFGIELEVKYGDGLRLGWIFLWRLAQMSISSYKKWASNIHTRWVNANNSP